MVFDSPAMDPKETKSVRTCPSTIYNAAPATFQKIPFSLLNTHSKFEDKVIIGKICHLNPIGRRVNGYIRKLLIYDALEEQVEEKKLTVFLLDQFAEQSEAAELDGYIVIANFFVENSTHPKDEFPFTILVKNDESQIWFGRKKAASQQKRKKKVKKGLQKNNDGAKEEAIVLKNHYDYTPLGELLETTEKSENFNVYGIVEKCDLKTSKALNNPKQILEVLLTDQTETGFPCSIYSPQNETFPDIYPGDIIRVHRMQVSKFRSRLKGKCLSSKFILVFSKNNEGSKPRTVAKSFTFTDEDASKVKELFEWYDKKNQPKLISEINRGDFVNILCQVIGVYIAKNSDTVIVKIWDGTKSNVMEGSHWGLREEKLDQALFNIAKNFYVVLFAYGHHCASAGELKPGQFIEVRDANLNSPKDNPDDCKLCLFSGNKDKRGVQVLNMDDNRLLELKRRLEKIVADAQEFGNHTEDILSENNSIFLNCDISVLPTSQKTCHTEEDRANISVLPTSQKTCHTEEDRANAEALNEPLSQRNVEQGGFQEPQVVSFVDAAIKPGQSTQEFGAVQRDYQEVIRTGEADENELPAFTQPDLALNKTPIEFRLHLHNPSSQSGNTPQPPFTSDTPDDWWTTLAAASVSDGHESVKPSSLAEVVNHEVPYKFRIFGVVLGYKPSLESVQQLIRLHCPKCFFLTEDVQPSITPLREQDGLFYFNCPDCLSESEESSSTVLQYTYVFSLDMHDGTGPAALEVIAFGENAVKFLKGISPEQVLRNKTAADSVLQMLWSICPNSRPNSEGVNTNYNTYPILDCCIMSYEISDQTFHQLFDTRLL